MFAAITLMVVAVANSASAQNSWSFVMLGDTRGDDNTVTGVSPYLNIIAQKIAALNPQLVMMAGDLCNGNCLNTNSPLYPAGGDFTNAAAYSIYASEFANWKTAMQPIFDYSTGTGIPIYTVRGNHENEDGEHAPISVLKQAYYDAFSAYVPANGPSNSLADDQRGFSWSFTHNNVTFVAADQYFNYTNASPDQLSGYHSLDRAWVTQQFQQSTSPYKIFMAHEPIFQTEGNGPGEMVNEEAQHFFGTNTAGFLTRADFWNALGTNGVQLYLTGHLHLETVANTTNDYGNTIIQLTAGNGGAPPQPFIDNPEPGVTTLFNNGNTLVISNGHASVNGIFGFSLATVQDDFMTIQYYSLNTNDNSWTVADFVTQIAGYGGPLGHRVSIDRNGTGVVINFIGKLQSADTILGPWTNVTNTSPYTVTATNSAKFYRAAE
jgi:hypothetical protein